jgi:hypothetical protein
MSSRVNGIVDKHNETNKQKPRRYSNTRYDEQSNSYNRNANNQIHSIRRLHVLFDGHVLYTNDALGHVNNEYHAVKQATYTYLNLHIVKRTHLFTNCLSINSVLR